MSVAVPIQPVDELPGTIEVPVPQTPDTASAAAAIVSSLGPEPWNAPWWKPSAGEWPTFLYIVGLHVLGAAGVILFPEPGLRIALVTGVVAWMGGLGVTVCYHRTLAHGAVRLHPTIRHLLIFFAMFNGSGAPDSWTANHRQHHARVETPEDISSPQVGGFWWSHLRWLWQAGNVPLARWCPDLDKPGYRAWNRLQIPLLAISLFGALPFGAAAFFWFGPMRLLLSLHAQCLINSVAHMRKGRLPGEDSSQNIGWLTPVHFFQGENWHGNHHAKPWSARLGWRPWQIDFGWYAIVLFEAMGLATKVRRPNSYDPR